MMTDPQEPPPRPAMIAVVGDASLEPASAKALVAESVGKALVDAGYHVVTGGLGGVMLHASKGARASPAYRPGMIVGVLPGHDPAEANPYVDVAIPTGIDHLRNPIVANADAVVAIGGGAGTLSEICFAWTYLRPIVALRVDGWSGRLADESLDRRERCPDIPDDRIYGADDAAQVIALLRERLPLYPRRNNPVRTRSR